VAEQDYILDVRNLKKHFPIEKGFIKKVVGYIRAVDDVSFTIKTGECVGLVGESGCGKTTTGRAVLRAIDPTDGSILFRKNDEVVDLATLDAHDLRLIRRDVQMIFQDPYSSLNPRMRVRDIVGEPLYENRLMRGRQLEERVKDLLQRVGLKKEHLTRYPHAFSGGQRQRIGIARALALRPRLIVADEPVSALDVSVQAQILNLLQDIQQEMDLSYLFVAHDLSVVRHISDRVIVMYVGKIAEIAETDELYDNPLHPYTAALLSAIPVPDPDKHIQSKGIEGEVADPSQIYTGCNFASRCPYAQQRCHEEVPQLRDLSPEGAEPHYTACHFPLFSDR
jgi:peptide/nickel transport system ATP-binding protein